MPHLQTISNVIFLMSVTVLNTRVQLIITFSPMTPMLKIRGSKLLRKRLFKKKKMFLQEKYEINIKNRTSVNNEWINVNKTHYKNIFKIKYTSPPYVKNNCR